MSKKRSVLRVCFMGKALLVVALLNPVFAYGLGVNEVSWKTRTLDSITLRLDDNGHLDISFVPSRPGDEVEVVNNWSEIEFKEILPFHTTKGEFVLLMDTKGVAYQLHILSDIWAAPAGTGFWSKLFPSKQSFTRVAIAKFHYVTPQYTVAKSGELPNGDVFEDWSVEQIIDFYVSKGPAQCGDLLAAKRL